MDGRYMIENNSMGFNQFQPQIPQAKLRVMR